MTRAELRDQLDRIADQAPPATVDVSIFDRGRRAVRRARVLIGLGAVACLALLAAVVPPLLDDEPAPVDTKPVPVVPNHLYAVPDQVTSDRVNPQDVRPAAAAFVTELGTPILVDAYDGTYYPVRLSGFAELNDEVEWPDSGPPLALSPDGNKLAWGWKFDEPSGEATYGVRIFDLRTGEVTKVEPGGGLIKVTRLQWSSNSRWLAWAGEEPDPGDEPVGQQLGGVIAPNGEPKVVYDFARPEIVTAGRRLPSTEVYVAVSNKGEFAARTGNAIWRDQDLVRFPHGADDRIGMGIWFRGDRLLGYRDGFPTSATAEVVELPSLRRVEAAANGLTGTWLAELAPGVQLIVETAQELKGAEWAPAVHLVTADGTDRQVIELEPGVLELTVASDLMGPDGRTYERPEPDWGSGSGWREATLVTLLVVGFIGGGWLLRRRLMRVAA